MIPLFAARLFLRFQKKPEWRESVKMDFHQIGLWKLVYHT